MQRCRYCGGEIIEQNNLEVFGRDSTMLVCINYPTCDSYGRWDVADRALRIKRIETHDLFDVLWKELGHTRTEAYKKLSKFLRVKKAHIGTMSIEQCDRVIDELVKPNNFFVKEN